MIPLSEPVISGNEWKYVKDCLDTGWVSSAGPYVKRFEDAIAAYTNAKYAVATINGTSALHLSLLACGVKQGDEVIVPTLTFIAPVNSVTYCGATPVFMDCDPETFCINTQKLSRFIKENTVKGKDGFTYNKTTKRRVKAVIPVHIFGHPAEMDSLADICSANNIDVIEDATESLGSQYKSKSTGSIGTIGCFSFNGNKIVTTGGGGMVITDDKIKADRVRHLSTQAKIEGIEYYHDAVGYNYRLSNVSAAIGVAQFEKIDDLIAKKRANAALYRQALSKCKGVEFLWEKPWARTNFWFYAIKVAKSHKDGLIKHLIEHDIQVRPIWKLIHTLPMYMDCQRYDIVNAIEAYETCINIPCSTNLTNADIEQVVSGIRSYFNG